MFFLLLLTRHTMGQIGEYMRKREPITNEAWRFDAFAVVMATFGNGTSPPHILIIVTPVNQDQQFYNVF